MGFRNRHETEFLFLHLFFVLLWIDNFSFWGSYFSNFKIQWSINISLRNYRIYGDFLAHKWVYWKYNVTKCNSSEPNAYFQVWVKMCLCVCVCASECLCALQDLGVWCIGMCEIHKRREFSGYSFILIISHNCMMQKLEFEWYRQTLLTE